MCKNIANWLIFLNYFLNFKNYLLLLLITIHKFIMNINIIKKKLSEEELSIYNNLEIENQINQELNVAIKNIGLYNYYSSETNIVVNIIWKEVVFGQMFKAAYMPLLSNEDKIILYYNLSYRDVVGVWEHELTHAIDYKILDNLASNFYKQGLQSYAKYYWRKLTTTNEGSEIKMGLFIPTLLNNTLEHLRAESFATLIQKIIYNNSPIDWATSDAEVGDNLTLLLADIVTFEPKENEGLIELMQHVVKSKIRLYTFSKELMLNAIYYYKPELRDELLKYKAENFNDVMCWKDGLSIEKLIAFITQLSVLDFVFANIQQSIVLLYDMGNTGINFIQLCHHAWLTDNDKLDIALDYSIIYAIDKDKPQELKQKLQIFDTSITDEELDVFINNINDNSISTVYNNLIQRNVNQWKNENNTFARRKLKYAASKYDLITDNIGFIGVLDDMLILDL